MKKALSERETGCYHVLLGKIKKEKEKKEIVIRLNLVFINNTLMEISSYLVSNKNLNNEI